MNATDWTAVPKRLEAAGFAVHYERVSYESKHPLWCAKAVRGEREWVTMASDLSAAFTELERQTHEGATDWRNLDPLETSAQAKSPDPQARASKSRP